MRWWGIITHELVEMAMTFEATTGIVFAECKLMGRFSPDVEKPSFMVNKNKNVFFPFFK